MEIKKKQSNQQMSLVSINKKMRAFKGAWKLVEM